MKDNKTKDFTNFMKQDFDIVKDYKNASKELTPKEVWKKILNTDEKVNGQWTPQVKTMLQDGDILFISKALDKLETLEKRDTPMKVLKEYWEQEHPDYHYFLEGLRDVVEKIMEDWSGDNE